MWLIRETFCIWQHFERFDDLPLIPDHPAGEKSQAARLSLLIQDPQGVEQLLPYPLRSIQQASLQEWIAILVYPHMGVTPIVVH